MYATLTRLKLTKLEDALRKRKRPATIEHDDDQNQHKIQKKSDDDKWTREFILLDNFQQAIKTPAIYQTNHPVVESCQLKWTHVYQEHHGSTWSTSSQKHSLLCPSTYY